MTTLPAGTAVSIDGVTHYLTEQIEVPTTTKTTYHLAREWLKRVAPECHGRFQIDSLGYEVANVTCSAANKFANSWPSRAIAERRAKQIAAENLLILAAMWYNAEHPPEPDGIEYCVDYISTPQPFADGWGVFTVENAGIGVVRFHRSEDAEETKNHLYALGLLEYLILDMEGGEQ